MPAPGAAEGAEERLERLVAESRAGFAASFGVEPAVTCSAPGRINVIGEHTDYNDGLALPGAIDRWVLVSLAPCDDDEVVIESDRFAPAIGWPAESPLAGEAPLWGQLVYGASVVFFQSIDGAQGYRARISGDVPLASGVSSSAAAEMALFGALRAAFEADLSDLDLVLAAQRVEHDHLGVATGLMDQYTSQFSRPDSLMKVDFSGPDHEYVVAELDDWVWVLVNTLVTRELAASAYGDRVVETRRAFAEIAAADPGVTAFQDLRERHLGVVEDAVGRRRLRHYVRENERVRLACEALSSSDVSTLGALMLESHASLRDDYEVSCDELDCLVDSTMAIPDCAGARMMGGGFGGCTVNLVRGSGVEHFVRLVSPEFESRFGYAPEAAVYTLAGGARCHPQT